MVGPRAGVAVDVYATEEELLRAWGERVRKIDPDVLMGYEIQRSSWGYVVDRAAFAYRMYYAVWWGWPPRPGLTAGTADACVC